jgi:hypothetical protein
MKQNSSFVADFVVEMRVIVIEQPVSNDIVAAVVVAAAVAFFPCAVVVGTDAVVGGEI